MWMDGRCFRFFRERKETFYGGAYFFSVKLLVIILCGRLEFWLGLVPTAAAPCF